MIDEHFGVVGLCSGFRPAGHPDLHKRFSLLSRVYNHFNKLLGGKFYSKVRGTRPSSTCLCPIIPRICACALVLGASLLVLPITASSMKNRGSVELVGAASLVLMGARPGTKRISW